MTDSEKTTAAIEGPAWSAGALGWVDHWARFAAPAREAVARAGGIEAGASVLDVGCGSGEFCELAAARCAQVSGIDAAVGLVEWQGAGSAKQTNFAPILRIGPEVAERVVRTTVRRMPSRSGDPIARAGSRTGSGI